MSDTQETKQLVLKIGLLVGLVVLLVGMFVLFRAIMPNKGPVFRGSKSAQRPKAPPPPLSSYKPADAKTLAQGKKLFLQHCTLCHGNTGRGDGPGGRGLRPRPTPYIWGQFRYGSRFEDIMKVLKEGSPNRGSGMISWGWLPKVQREALSHYILHLAYTHAPKPARRPRPRPRLPSGPTQKASAKGKAKASKAALPAKAAPPRPPKRPTKP